MIGTVEAPFLFNPMETSSIQESVKGEVFSVYPNPTSDKVYMKFALEDAQNSSIRIIDRLGQVAKEIQLDIPAGKHVLECNTGDLTPGMYTVKFGEQSRKLLILR